MEYIFMNIQKLEFIDATRVLSSMKSQQNHKQTKSRNETFGNHKFNKLEAKNILFN
jgi:hypothetical protein